MSDEKLIETFREELQIRENAHGDEYAEKTIKSYVRNIRHWRDWLHERDMSLDGDVTTRDVRLFLSDMSDEYAENTVANMRKAITLFYRYVADAPADPTEGLDRSWSVETEKSKTMSDPVEYLTKDEVETLLDSVPSPSARNRLLLKVMIMAGVRRSEAATLEVDRVDLDAQTLEVWDEKNDEYRTVGYNDPDGRRLTRPLRIWLDTQREALHDVSEDNPYVFPSEQGETDHISGDRVRVTVHRAAKNAGLQDEYGTDANGNTRYVITPHTLRHTFAVWCFKAGVTAPYVRDQLGHHDISVSEVYSKLAKEDAAEKIAESGPTF